MNKRILLLANRTLKNSLKKAMVDACEASDTIDLVIIEPRKFSLKTEKGKVIFFLNGEEFVVNPKRDYFFVQSPGQYKGSTILFMLYAKHVGAKFVSAQGLYQDLRTTKISQMVSLASANISHPISIVGTPRGVQANQKVIEETFTYPVVYKEPGCGGEQVFLLTTWEELEDKLVTAAEQAVPHVLVQENIEKDKDWRVFVYKEKILGVIEKNNPGEFLTNLSQGGVHTLLTEWDERLSDVSVEAAKAVEMNFAAVDMVHDNQKDVCKVMEVNHSPGVKGVEDVISTQLIECIEEDLNDSQ